MLVLARLILLGLCIGMFYVKRENKLIIFIVSLLLLRCINLFSGSFFSLYQTIVFVLVCSYRNSIF